MLLVLVTFAVITAACGYYVSVTDDDDADQHLPCPDFSKYLYFLFAPTLVYRDVYPR